MTYPLRHSHIALRRSISSLAKAVGSSISTGIDDLGHYQYFDLIIEHADGERQRVRLASHDADEMSHLLAERTTEVSDLAAVLFSVGIRRRSELSISTDHQDKPLRNLEDIWDRYTAMSKSPELKFLPSSDDRTPALAETPRTLTIR